MQLLDLMLTSSKLKNETHQAQLSFKLLSPSPPSLPLNCLAEKLTFTALIGTTRSTAPPNFAFRHHGAPDDTQITGHLLTDGHNGCFLSPWYYNFRTLDHILFEKSFSDFPNGNVHASSWGGDSPGCLLIICASSYMLPSHPWPVSKLGSSQLPPLSPPWWSHPPPLGPSTIYMLTTSPTCNSEPNLSLELWSLFIQPMSRKFL